MILSSTSTQFSSVAAQFAPPLLRTLTINSLFYILIALASLNIKILVIHFVELYAEDSLRDKLVVK
jgi:hypothetical protein